jgi:hypothetical protein
MYKSTGKLEHFLWNQATGHPDIIGAVWIEAGEIRAQALRHDFDMNTLHRFINRSISSAYSHVYSIRHGFGYLLVIPAEDHALLILETTRDLTFDFRDYGNNDKSPYIYINPDMGYGYS